jgi:fructan beta-fructosidase
VAYSTDGARTWTEYDKNPVVKHVGRDPKLVWYEKGKHWVMAVYDESQGKQWIAFYTSPDLKAWTFASRIDGFFECPDLFPLPARSDPRGAGKWVLYAADGKYVVGEFDGKTFKPDFKEKKQLWYGSFYAAQSFDNAPRPTATLTGSPAGPSRRVQIGWAQNVTFPGTPFNQQMTVPVDLDSLWTDKGGWQLLATPAPELETLRDGKPVVEVREKEPVTTAKPFTLAENLDAYELEVFVEPKKAAGFTLDLRGTKLTYDAAKETLTCNGVTAPLKLRGGVLLRVLADRGSVEVFSPLLLGWSDVAMSVPALPDEKNHKLGVIPDGGEITVRGAKVYRMKSVWGK